MSDNWTMPDWMREIYEAVGQNSAADAGRIRAELEVFSELADGYLHELQRLRAENKQMRNALAKIGEWLLIHDLTIVDKMKQVAAALGAEHE